MTLPDLAALCAIHDYCSKTGYHGVDLQAMGKILQRELDALGERNRKELEDDKRHAERVRAGRLEAAGPSRDERRADAGKANPLQSAPRPLEHKRS
jgi:hypothetical protein